MLRSEQVNFSAARHERLYSMYTLIYFLIGSVNLALLIYAIQCWRRTRSVAILLIILPVSFLWYDNYLIAAGRFIGEGKLLESLSSIRFFSHYLLLPLMFIVVGMIARRAGYRWAQPRIVMGLFCIACVAFMVWETAEYLMLDLYPVCLGDTLRYSTWVAPEQACDPSMAGLGGYVPLAGSVLLVFSFIGLGVMLWRTHGWPWLFAGAVIILIFAGIPSSVAGPFLSNIGEPIVNFALLMTVLRLEQRG